MMAWQLLLQLISQAAALISVFVLYRGSFGVPWDKRTWGGKSPLELVTQRKQAILCYFGLGCAFVSIGCQTILSLWG
jgi:hypothetical protein